MQSVPKNLSWQRMLPLLEKYFVLFILIAQPLGLAAAPERASEGTMFKVEQDTCLSDQCHKTASQIMKKMDKTVNPCDNFYKFSCGNYLKTETIPKDSSVITIFTNISDQVKEKLYDLIVEERPETGPKYLHLPNKFYKACMNKTLNKEVDTSPITEIAKSLGGWPVLMKDQWDLNGTWTWQETVKKLRKTGVSFNSILSVSIGIDLKNTTKRIIQLDQTAVMTDLEYLVEGLNNTNVDAYYKYIVDIAVMFGADRNFAETELQKSLEFEINLAKICVQQKDRRNINDLYNLMSIAELQKNYPYLNWMTYINSILPEGLTVDENEIVNVVVPSFFKKLNSVLEATPKRVIANNMLMRVHTFFVRFLPEDFRKRFFEYRQIFSGIQEMKGTRKKCISKTINNLDIAIGSLYVQKYFNKNEKNISFEMARRIQNAFREMLSQVDWMDNATKEIAQQKLKSMAIYIGYPDEILDNAKLEEHYQNWTIDDNENLQSILKTYLLSYDNSYGDLRKPINKTDWKSHADSATAHAEYSLTKNSIQFSAANLQDPLFNAKNPKYMNFGAIGALMGHEITHGFDDLGSEIDGNGNFIEWWQNDTKTAFLSKTECIINQYGNYTESSTGYKINGINTQGENIADNGGIKAAYRAYEKWTEEFGTEQKLPDMNFTAKQLFWISYGQMWCEKYTKAAMAYLIFTDVHPPAEIRVMGVLKNNKEFSKDFNCPLESPMNPREKCEVW